MVSLADAWVLCGVAGARGGGGIEESRSPGMMCLAWLAQRDSPGLTWFLARVAGSSTLESNPDALIQKLDTGTHRAPLVKTVLKVRPAAERDGNSPSNR